MSSRLAAWTGVIGVLTLILAFGAIDRFARRGRDLPATPDRHQRVGKVLAILFPPRILLAVRLLSLAEEPQRTVRY